MSTAVPVRHRPALAVMSALVLLAALLGPALARFDPSGAAGVASEVGIGHLVISEVATGGASASDEFVELYNPSAAALPLEGLELVYVTASGATVTRKAAWGTGALALGPGAHLLVANEAGAYASIADATYANGIAATGGSMALRIIGAATAVDAVGWGAATAWLEGTPVAAPAVGASIERLPGGTLGSTQDTDDNAVDFVARAVPDPQNAASPPVTPPASPTASPSASATPSATATVTPVLSPSPTLTPTVTPSASPTTSPTASPTPTPAPTSTPSPELLTIAAARALPDGGAARIAGVALMGSAFADGGGCVWDGTAGIAVLPDGAAFAHGDLVTADGLVDDRYAQRTLRVSAGGLALTGTAPDPIPVERETGAIGETVECALVELTGVVTGAPSELSSGLAFDLDDGSGPTRVLVASASGIDTAAWDRGATVTVRGVVGQRDSSGSGAAGYRVQPRGTGDVVSVVPPATPSPTPSASASGTPSPSPSASPTPSVPADLVTIAAARAAATGTLVHVRGVVTLGTGLVDEATAVIQDPSAAIVLRLEDGAGSVRRGTLVDVAGIRSTKAGMLTIRVAQPPTVLGSQADPAPVRSTSGGLGETLEARLVVVRGAVIVAPTRSTANNVAFTVDDGSGPVRVTLYARGSFGSTVPQRGDWLEVTAILGQETTGALPNRGYYLWPRAAADLALVASASGASSPASSHDGSGSGAGVGATRNGLPGGAGSRGTPRPAQPIDRPAPALGDGSGSAAARGDGGPNGAPADPDVRLTAATRGLPPGLPLLLLALSLTVMFGTAAWRCGALGRLRDVIRELALASESEPGTDDGTGPGRI